MDDPRPNALTTALQAHGLYHIYHKGNVNTVALRGASLVLERSTWTTVMGPSGSGKSTLLHILAGLLEPSAGVVTVEGMDVTRLPPATRAEWRRRSVGLVLQRDNLHPHLDAAENISLPLRIQGRRPGEISDRVHVLLAQTGLTARSAHRIGQLSGGEAQRVAIAVALANRPAVLLADEPTGELDEKTAGGILDLFETLQNGRMAILTVTHNRQVTERASRKLTMHDGVLINGQ
jgi:ABC-type lipoprotein export system ATPase subunit